MAVLELVVKRLDDKGIAMLQQALDAERSVRDEDFPTVGHDLHAVLAQVAGNRVLELLSLVLVRLTRIHQARPPGATGSGTDDAMRAHQRLVDAIVDRDIELARHRMRRHLDALQSWVR
jgi:DNA-binding FadR family transcriptional regulator